MFCIKGDNGDIKKIYKPAVSYITSVVNKIYLITKLKKEINRKLINSILKTSQLLKYTNIQQQLKPISTTSVVSRILSYTENTIITVLYNSMKVTQ